jgi:hypothetical protein
VSGEQIKEVARKAFVKRNNLFNVIMGVIKSVENKNA